MGPLINVEDEPVTKILTELGGKLDDEASCEVGFDSVCTNTILTNIDASVDREKIRREVAEAFVVSSWTQRI